MKPSALAVFSNSGLIRKVSDITLDIDKGDTLLGGKFKNSPMTVDEFGTDENGQPTVNDKKLLAMRIEKKMPGKDGNVFNKKESGMKRLTVEEIRGVLKKVAELKSVMAGIKNTEEVPVSKMSAFDVMTGRKTAGKYPTIVRQDDDGYIDYDALFDAKYKSYHDDGSLPADFFMDTVRDHDNTDAAIQHYIDNDPVSKEYDQIRKDKKQGSLRAVDAFMNRM